MKLVLTLAIAICLLLVNSVWNSILLARLRTAPAMAMGSVCK